MSYVPGGDPTIAEGFVTDFVPLRAALARALTSEGFPGEIASRLSTTAQRSVVQPAHPDYLNEAERRAILSALNDVISRADLAPLAPREFCTDPPVARLLSEREKLDYRGAQLRTAALSITTSDKAAAHARKLAFHRATRIEHHAERAKKRVNRALVERAFPGMITAAPSGSGVIVDGGLDDSYVIGALVTGWDGTERLGLFDLPWEAWWPSLELWGTVAVLLALASLCIAMIVHPQWSQRELLPYPIVGFLRDIVHTDGERRLPSICRSRLFLGGMGGMLFVNLINGLHAWFPAFPGIPLRLDFGPVMQLFPNVPRVGGVVWDLVIFTLYPIVIAFTYFIRSDVSLSLGLSHMAWTLVGVVCVTHGVQLNSSAMGWSATGLVHMGAFVGLTTVIAFTGRRYYWNVFTSAFGFRRHPETPAYSVWAARALLACIAIAILLLQRLAGLSWVFGATIVLGVLMASLVMARINAEGGVFLLDPGYSPTLAIPAIFGFKAIAPSQYYTATQAVITVWGDARGAALPFVLNGLNAAETVSKAPPRKTAPWMGGIIVCGFVLCLAISLLFQYNLGANMVDNWSRKDAIRPPFENLTRQVAHLGALGELGSVVSATDWQRLMNVNPDPEAVGWMIGGFATVAVLAAMRLRFHWWPLHPILVAVAALWHVAIFAPCFLLGWGIRIAVQKLAGARGYQVVKPFMVGIIAGELLSVIGWTIVGTAYYSVTGLVPTKFTILPN
jgi:hypothetical protein